MTLSVVLGRKGIVFVLGVMLFLFEEFVNYFICYINNLENYCVMNLPQFAFLHPKIGIPKKILTF